MKTRNTHTALAAAMALASAAALAQSDRATELSTRQTEGSDSPQIRRVSHDSVEQHVTAKDLIGSSVYDKSGEKIGDIADISVTRLVSDVDARRAQQQAQGKPQSARQQQATVFVSVGGLWGVGDQMVAVPADSLTYDHEEEVFVLTADKAQIQALADTDPVDFNDFSYYGWTLNPENYALNSQGDWENPNASTEENQSQQSDGRWTTRDKPEVSDRNVNDYSAKRSGMEYNDQSNAAGRATEIEKAIADDSQMQGETKIVVNRHNDQIILRGSVSSEQLKQRALEIAEQNTNLNVTNHILVRDESQRD